MNFRESLTGYQAQEGGAGVHAETLCPEAGLPDGGMQHRESMSIHGTYTLNAFRASIEIDIGTRASAHDYVRKRNISG